MIKTRSKFEEDTIKQLEKDGVEFEYEKLTLHYELPMKKYKPDLQLKNGIIIELKGYFKTSDRQILLALQRQQPLLDIRIVFQNAHNKIHKNSNTTYAKWCDTYGILWGHKTIPKEWINE